MFRSARQLAMLLGALASMLAMTASADAAPPAVRHLYAVGRVGNARILVPFDVSSSGQFTEREAQAVPVPASVSSVLVGRDARTVYVGSRMGFDNDDNLIPGTIQVYAVAPDGALSLVQTISAPPRQMVLAPDGSRLFEWDDYGLVVSFPIGADGTLGAARPNPSVTGSARALAVAPSGSTLYVATYPQQLQQYAIGSDGALTALTPSEVGIFGCRADYLGVTPDGTQLDATCYSQAITLALGAGGGLTFNGSLFSTWGGGPNVEDVRGRAFYKAIYPNALEHLQRQPGGTLADFPTPLIFDAATVSGIAADPGGTQLAVATAANRLETWGITSDGSLSAAPSTWIATTLNSLSLLVYAPDQPPRAVLSARPDGLTAHLDAGASEAVNGTIARFDWTFGDGSVLLDGGPAPSHTYATAGDYSVGVTLTDGEGCSVAETFTGAMSICAGSPAAATRQVVHVAPLSAPTPLPPSAPGPGATAPPATAPPLQPAAEVLVVPHSLTGTPTLRGQRVRLAWLPVEDAPPSTRYLVAWSSLHSSQGPADPLMHHTWTSDAHVLMPGARGGTTLHYAVYAYGSDGTLVKAAKTTIRLPRGGGEAGPAQASTTMPNTRRSAAPSGSPTRRPRTSFSRGSSS
jgi:hypothetical protein